MTLGRTRSATGVADELGKERRVGPCADPLGRRLLQEGITRPGWRQRQQQHRTALGRSRQTQWHSQ